MIDIPLLTTKLFIPLKRDDMLDRLDLVQRLNDGLAPGKRLILISAPAGFGKTTLLSEWTGDLLKRAVTVCWLSLDETDGAPKRFITYLIAAIQSKIPHVGKSAKALLESPVGEDEEAILTSMLNDMADFSNDLILIMDDYHLIESKPVQKMVGFLIDHLPPNCRLVISGRIDPPIALARYRGRGQVIELRANDIRFKRSELLDLFKHTWMIDLSDDQIDAVEERIEGWPAGLQLLAHSIQAHADASGVIAAFKGSSRFILDYLVEEVLNTLPQDVQAFLLITSPLKRLSSGVCNAVTGQYDSQNMLDKLERDNLFVISLDNQHTWFRYHHLFAEFLLHRLISSEQNRENEYSLNLIYSKASLWFEENHLWMEAVEYAFLAGEIERVAGIIELSGRTFYLPGTAGLLLTWLDKIPREIIFKHARLCLVYAWASLSSGKRDEIDTFLEAASLSPISNDVEIYGEIATMQALLAVLRGKPDPAIAYAKQALDNLPEGDWFLRGFVNYNLGMAHEISNRLDEAEWAYNEAFRMGQQAEPNIVTIMAGSQLADLKVVHGQLQEAEQIYRKMLSIINQIGSQIPLAGLLYLRLGSVLYEWNQLDAAEASFMKTIELGKRWEGADMQVVGYTYLVLIKNARGLINEAEDMRKMALKAATKQMISPPSGIISEAILARVAFRLGYKEEAITWVEKYSSDEEMPDYVREIIAANRARILIGCGNPESALELVNSRIPLAQSAGRRSNLIELLAVKASALQALNKTLEALTVLSQALSLGEAGRFVRTFADEGNAIGNLIISLCQSFDDGAYACKLAEVCNANSLPVITHVKHDDYPLQPLSSRELEVLKLLAEGQSNQEIAENLVIALSTVKTHINNIYAKLQVQGRVQAAAIARKIDLI